MKSFRCPLCGNTQQKTRFHLHSYSIVMCLHCAHVYTLLPKTHIVTTFNTANYSKTYLTEYTNRKPILQKRFRKHQKQIDALVSGGQLLDVGCSNGMFLETFELYTKNTWSLYGIDINALSIRQAKKITRAQLTVGFLKNAHYPPNSFDCITLFDVLEHDPDPVGLLGEISRILKPGGLLVVQCPNYVSDLAWLAGSSWDWWSVPDHVSHFSYRILKQTIESVGFHTVRAYTWNARRDFVSIVQGTLKQRLPSFLYIHKIIAKLSPPFLNCVWFVSHFFYPITHRGALSVVYARKNK